MAFFEADLFPICVLAFAAAPLQDDETDDDTLIPLAFVASTYNTYCEVWIML